MIFRYVLNFKNRVLPDYIICIIRRLFLATFIIFTLIFFAAIIVPFISALESFQVSLTPCMPSWYCTDYSQESCGSRECLDSNACGNNEGKPTEYLECPPSGGSRRDSSDDNFNEEPVSAESNNTVTSPDTSPDTSPPNGTQTDISYEELMPEGYFTLGDDILKVRLELGQRLTKKINIHSYYDLEYSLAVKYPEGIGLQRGFITSLQDTVPISKGANEDFSLIFNAENTLSGSYVIPLRLYNKYYYKDIVAIVDVVDSQTVSGIIIAVLPDGLQTEFISAGDNILIKLDFDDYFEENLTNISKVSYEIIDSDGFVIAHWDDSYSDTSLDLEKSVQLPSNLPEGYYFIRADVTIDGMTTQKTVAFSVLSDSKYSPVNETPLSMFSSKNSLNRPGIVIILASAIILVIFIAISIIWYHRFRMSSHKNSTSSKISNLSLNSKDKGADMLDYSKKAHNNVDTSADGVTVDDVTADGVTVDAVTADGATVDSVMVQERHALLNKKNAPAISDSSIRRINIIGQSLDAGFITRSEYEQIISRLEGDSNNIIKTPNPDPHPDPHPNPALDPVPIKHKVLPIMDSGPEKSFKLRSGKNLRTIPELIAELKTMPIDDFMYHVNADRNDFANWILGVFNLQETYDKIKNLHDRNLIIAALEEELLKTARV